MKKYIPHLIYAIAAVLIVHALIPAKEEVVRTVKVPVPVVEHHFDTIREPVPHAVIKTDTIYYPKGESPVERPADTLTRTYKETFEDSIQTIDVYTKVKGRIEEQSVSYKTKPRVIEHTDTIQVPVRPYFSVGVEGTVPAAPSLNGRPAIKVGIGYTTSKKTTYSVSVDTDKRLWVGIRFRL